ncbi:MAG: protoporphyrinogen/coproporphyrinogen oxidase, partial [Bryobacteraceae bacterium]
GLGSLVDALAARVARVRGEAEAIEPAPGGLRVRVSGEWMEARHVILACEAWHAAALVDGRLAELLAATPYHSSIVIALGYDLSRPPEGFGFLVPRRERRRVLAATYVGTKFSHRVPEGRFLLRVFLGGPGCDAALAEPDETLLPAVLAEIAEMTGITAPPRFSRIYRLPRSMAQYTVGHAGRVAEIESLLPPGLHLAGNAVRGIGIPDCIREAKRAVERIVRS